MKGPKVLIEIPKNGVNYAARLVETEEGELAIEFQSPNAMGDRVWTTSRYLEDPEHSLITALLAKKNVT